MTTRLTCTFRSVKPRNRLPLSPNSPKSPKLPTSDLKSSQPSSNTAELPWCVYLIASTNSPIKTYVGVTNNFSRRLKQHNGEIKGGAKASQAGRPWICACIIKGFEDRSEACSFESKWKLSSRKLPRQRKADRTEKLEDNRALPLLQHRYAALEKVKHSCNFDHLEIEWQLSPS